MFCLSRVDGGEDVTLPKAPGVPPVSLSLIFPQRGLRRQVKSAVLLKGLKMSVCSPHVWWSDTCWHVGLGEFQFPGSPAPQLLSDLMSLMRGTWEVAGTSRGLQSKSQYPPSSSHHSGLRGSQYVLLPDKLSPTDDE